MLRFAVPDMVSSSFFPVVAAVDLGFFHDEGVDASVELLPPESKLFAALRDGELDFVAGSAHATLCSGVTLSRSSVARNARGSGLVDITSYEKQRTLNRSATLEKSLSSIR
jgi:hypothetical protein